MTDKIEKIGSGSLIQHGKLNERVYLMKLSKADFPEIIPMINSVAQENQYTKLFCKVPAWAAPGFMADGFITEAYIPNFYQGSEAAFFVSKFLNSDRLLDVEYEMLKTFSNMLVNGVKKHEKVRLPEKIKMRRLEENAAGEITELYRQVFKTYPFPIHNEDYIRKTMNEGVQYYGAFKKKKLIALSSAETDQKGGNAEMTDFATLPVYRGNNLSVALLREMEKSMKKQKIKCLYTIARLNSMAMNKTFLKCGYKYSGTLIKNTNIAGKIESMNVLYKTPEN